MRTIKFRGKTRNGAWLYGDLSTFLNSAGIKKYFINGALVIPETVGQFIGLYDINGEEIYEGDYVKVVGGDNDLGLVKWFDGEVRYLIEFDDYGAKDWEPMDGYDWEVVDV